MTSPARAETCQGRTDDAAASRPRHVLTLVITNMDCPTEEAILRKALEGVDGVHLLEFDLMERTLRVSHVLSDPAPILAAITALGMTPVVNQTEPRASGRVAQRAGPAISRRQWIRISVAGVAAIGAEVVAYATGAETSLLVAGLALTAIFTGGLETLKKGWIALRTLSLNMNLLMSAATIGAIAIGEWPEAAVVIWLFGIAEMIEVLSLDRARDAIRKLMALAPETATTLLPDGTWRELRAETVPLGAIVRVKPGERIALDGVVEAGQSSVNQAPITGESIPVEKGAGAPVFAGRSTSAAHSSSGSLPPRERRRWTASPAPCSRRKGSALPPSALWTGLRACIRPSCSSSHCWSLRFRRSPSDNPGMTGSTRRWCSWSSRAPARW